MLQCGSWKWPNHCEFSNHLKPGDRNDVIFSVLEQIRVDKAVMMGKKLSIIDHNLLHRYSDNWETGLCAGQHGKPLVMNICQAREYVSGSALNM